MCFYACFYSQREEHIAGPVNALAKICNDPILQNEFKLLLGNWMRLCIEEWNDCETSNSVRNPNRLSLGHGECAR